MIKEYNAPFLVELGTFHADTRGVWFGGYRDVFGGKAVAKVSFSW